MTQGTVQLFIPQDRRTRWYPYEPVWIAVSQGLKQHRMNHCEYRRGSGNTKTQCDNRCNGKKQVLTQSTRGVFYVLLNFVQHCHGVEPPDVLANQCWIPELLPRSASSFLWRHASVNILFCFVIKIRLQFVGSFAIPIRASKEAAQSHRVNPNEASEFVR